MKYLLLILLIAFTSCVVHKKHPSYSLCRGGAAGSEWQFFPDADSLAKSWGISQGYLDSLRKSSRHGNR
jgi:hypothetical protein